MKNGLKQFLSVVIPSILIILSIIFQFAGTENLSPREQGLISTVQLVCSLWFGWIVSEIASESGFKEKQKKFAISAYRRIKEIEITIDRLLGRLESKIGTTAINPELDTIREIALSLQTTTLSSKADWGEIIGEEIKTLEEIEKVESSEPEQQNGSQKKVEQLLEKLPSSLEIQAREVLKSKEPFKKGLELFSSELENKGYIVLDGFWDESFEVDVHTLSIGTILEISFDDVKGRVGALIAHTNEGKSVGVITNNIGTSYQDFSHALIRVLHKSRFKAEYIEKREAIKSKKTLVERHYFKIKITK